MIVHTTIEKDHPIEFPLEKYVGSHYNTDQDADDFWDEFMAEEEFLLEPGDYEVIANIMYTLTDEPGERKYYSLTVSKAFTVE